MSLLKTNNTADKINLSLTRFEGTLIWKNGEVAISVLTLGARWRWTFC